jgi:drug/metabolite transporter (DMT)-like permease
MREDKSDPIAYSIVFQVLVSSVIFITGLLIGDMALPDLKPLIPFLILMTILYAGANIFIFNALKRTEASNFSITFSSRTAFTIFASSLLLGESLNPQQLLGVILIFASIVLVNTEKKKLKFTKNDSLGIIAGAFFGFANTNDRFILTQMNLYPYITISFLMPALLLFFLKPKVAHKMGVFAHKQTLTKMLILAVVYAGAAVTFFGALQKAPNSSQVVSIGTSTVVLTVILSIIFLKERAKIPLKILGGVVTTIGLLLVS